MFKDSVPHHVSVGIIHFFKFIEVDVAEDKLGARHAHERAQLFEKPAAVQRAGEKVHARQLFQFHFDLFKVVIMPHEGGDKPAHEQPREEEHPRLRVLVEAPYRREPEVPLRVEDGERFFNVIRAFVVQIAAVGDDLPFSVVGVYPPYLESKALGLQLVKFRAVQRLRVVKSDGDEAPELLLDAIPAGIDWKPADKGLSPLHEVKGAAEYEALPVLSPQRLNVALACGKIVKADHALIALERIDLFHDAARGQDDVPDRGVVYDGGGHFLEVPYPAVVLYHKRGEDLRFVQQFAEDVVHFIGFDDDELLHLGTFHLELVVHIGGSDGEHDHQRAEKNSGKGTFFSHGLFIYTQMNSPLGNPAALPRIAGHAVFAH